QGGCKSGAGGGLDGFARQESRQGREVVVAPPPAPAARGRGGARLGKVAREEIGVGGPALLEKLLDDVKSEGIRPGPAAFPAADGREGDLEERGELNLGDVQSAPQLLDQAVDPRFSWHRPHLYWRSGENLLMTHLMRQVNSQS